MQGLDACFFKMCGDIHAPIVALQLSEPSSTLREAVFLASPDLDESFHIWLNEPESERGHRVERALVRYFLRMAGRATPFGLFAGISVGDIAEQTRLVLSKRENYRRRTRLDMDYLVALAEALAQDPPLKSECFRWTWSN